MDINKDIQDVLDMAQGWVNECATGQEERDCVAAIERVRDYFNNISASVLESACTRVQKELFPLDNPKGHHRYTTMFSEVRDAIMGINT